MSADNKKRKKNTLTLEQKVEILGKLDRNIQANRVALDYGIAKSAVSYIKSQKENILSAAANTFQQAKKKSLHTCEYPKMEEQLYDWFLKQRERKCSMSGPIIKAKAKQIFPLVYPEKNAADFVASEGWFGKFKRRHGIRFIKICGEILSSDIESITPFIHRLHAKIAEMGVTNAQIYNADESGLFYRCLPDRTYVAACEKNAPGRKIRKERISILLGTNCDGSHKLNPLVIGKAMNPRCFKDFCNPLHYDNSKAAWMTSRIFHKWFQEIFIKEVSILLKNHRIVPKYKKWI